MSTTKRQKLSTCPERENISTPACEETYQYYTLDMLPPEVIEMILRFISFYDIATTVRLVSRRCSMIAATVLNGAFLKAGAKLEATMKRVQAITPNVKTEIALLEYNKAFNALELIQAQYKMLRAVTWRYTHPPKQEKFVRVCFYAGSLLDDLFDLLRRAIHRPETLTDPHSTSVTSFAASCKRFMNYFEKVSERRINRSFLVSGCKVVDVLDCLVEGRQILSFRVSKSRGAKGGVINMRLKYVMKRAWFTSLQVPRTATDENSWRDEQRFMYLRLRRLVGSVNEHLFERLHYERELLLQTMIPMPPPRPPPVSTYSGYGEYGGQFFYYGNMNKYAYDSKFKFPEIINWEDAGRDTDEELRSTPCFDLVIVVDLRCSPELAPLSVRSTLTPDDLKSFKGKVYNHKQLYLKLCVTCPASVANRLPGHFTWEVHNSRRGRHRRTV